MDKKKEEQQAQQAADIITVLADCNRGRFLVECGFQLREAIDASVRTGKKSKLTISLEFVPAGMKDGRVSQFNIIPEVTTKEARPSHGPSIFFLDEASNLTRNDPDQEEFAFEKEQVNEQRR